MESFEDKEIFELVRTGSFGRFTAANSFPVDFVLSSLDINDVKHLTFARELNADKLDFEMMMQRDIDEDRARVELAEYLYPTKKTEEELKTNVVFFPPLLVAILDVEDGNVSSYYPNMEKSIDGKFVSFQWGNSFKIRGISGGGKESYTVEDTPIKKTPVEIALNTDDDGAKLVVIDGQHRLFAIQEMLDSDNKNALKDINIPVCIVFPPHSTVGDKNKPSVTEVFRHLFVDVNSTMEQVGGHFTILLKDNNLSSITIRKWCDEILSKDFGSKLMSAIEWNTKSKKDSTILTKKYSVTSIGIIDKCLSETIAKSSRVLEFIFDAGFDIEWDNFDLTKKRDYEKLVNKKLVPLIDCLFSDIEVFSNAFDLHLERLIELEERSKQRGGKYNSKYKVVFNSILNSSPIPDDENGLCEDIYNEFINQVNNDRRRTPSFIINYSLFQRSIFLVWYTLMMQLRCFVPDPSLLTKLTVNIINYALKDDLDLFSFSRKYCQYTIWIDGTIKGSESTRKQFCRLMLAVVTKANVIDILRSSGIDHTPELELKLIELSESSISEYIDIYKEQRGKAFKVNYSRDVSIDEEEMEELDIAKREQEKHTFNFKLGKIDKSSVEYPFDELTDKHIQKDVDLITEELKQVIGFDFNPLSK